MDKNIWIDEALVQSKCCIAKAQPLILNGVLENGEQLIQNVAESIANWMETAAQNQRNTDYYRHLLVKIGEMIGDESYIQDDGGISEDVLCAKIPELVEKYIIKAVFNGK